MIRLILLLTFLESFASVLVQRGCYFASKAHLRFAENDNLWLAFVMGLCYVTGSLVSHAATQRWGERRVLLSVLGLQIAVCIATMWQPAPTLLFVGIGLIGLLHGVKWPLVESLVCANQTPREIAATLGKFNVTWSAAIAPSVVVVGPLVRLGYRPLWLVAAGISLVGVGLAWRLPARASHLPDDHPERPPEERMVRYRGLLTASRSLLLTSYALMWLLAALMPDILERLGVPPLSWWSPAPSAVLDVVRVAGFALLGCWTGWHNRSWPLVAAMLGIPISFALAVAGPSLWVSLGGQAFFGLFGVLVYYAALYYAMVVKNAAVDAGGWHEALIGLGSIVGPASGLLGIQVAGSHLSGPIATILGTIPLLIGCLAVAVWHVRPMRTPGQRGSGRAPE
jgi:MFS family permease